MRIGAASGDRADQPEHTEVHGAGSEALGLRDGTKGHETRKTKTCFAFAQIVALLIQVALVCTEGAFACGDLGWVSPEACDITG